MLFYPDYRFRRVWQISPEWLKQKGITTLLLDVDNTLTTHGSAHVPEEVYTWLSRMRDNHITLCVLSNNSEARVAPFAKHLEVQFFACAKKPLGAAARTAVAQIGAVPSRTAIVGDQLFTDVLCARLAGMIPILVEPIELEHYLFFRLKRFFERKLLNHCAITLEADDIEKR